ncbi:MAG: hypothetical protein K2P14_10990 [Anaeroplasmataceae bacterium]|nr:hypothetical protein [Anaeroplasmataceae bacterium]
MSDCVMQGNCVRVRNYKKKDNSTGCVVSMVDSLGEIIEFLGSGSFPEYPMGTPLRIGFNIRMFNGKPSGLNFDELMEVKK